MSTPIKALHVAPTPFFSNRGCHIRIRNVIDALSERGVRSILCTYHHGRSVPEIDTRRIPRIPGYTKTSVGFSPFKLVAAIPMFFLALSVAWRERPDIIHGHLHEGAFLGWLVRTFLFWRRIPLVMDMQGSLSGELEAYGTFGNFRAAIAASRAIEAMVCRLPAHFFCSSRQSRDVLVGDFGVSEERVSVTDDGVRPEFFEQRDPAELRHELRVPVDRTVVVYTGSFLEGKGMRHVYEAMRLLAAREDLLFLLIGYPEEPARRFVERHGLASSARVLGEVDYERLPSWLGAADLALEPKEAGSGEASGKLIHYMGAGLPVVCFDSPNNRGFLGDHGFFAAPGSSSAFAECIGQAAGRSPEAVALRRRHGEANRRRAAERFSWAAGGQTMIAAYRSILGREALRAEAEG